LPLTRSIDAVIEAVQALPKHMPRNLAYGKTLAVIGAWAVEPSDLAKAVDGNLSTATGEGSTTDTGVLTTIVYADLGRVYVVTSLQMLVGMRVSNASYWAQVYPVTSEDASTWADQALGTVQRTNSLTEDKHQVGAGINQDDTKSIRYVGLALKSSNAASTAYLKVYELVALGMDY